MSEQTDTDQQTPDSTTDRLRAFASRFVSSQIDQMEAMYEKAEKLEKQGVERWKKHLDEAVELGDETLDYLQTLGEEWREMQVETLRKLAGREDE
jgi:hypothetical protein